MRSRVSSVLIHIAVPLAAFITFLIQPIAGKLVLPIYGGGSGSWITCMFFFQGALLFGYGLAYFLARCGGSTRKMVVAGLAVLAPFSLKLPLVRLGADTTPISLLSTLGLSLGVQLLLTTSAGIVIQAWIQSKTGKVPYYLYAVSNIGSLLALIAYPFVIEPAVTLETQIMVVRGMSLILSVVVVALAWILERETTATSDVRSGSPAESLGLLQKGYWLVLSFFNCVMMLGATRVLSAEFGSNPLTWVIPLGFYLASFTITFSSWWPRSATMLALVVLCGSLPCYMLGKGIVSMPLGGSALPALVGIVAAASLVGNGILFEKRPQRDFASFYLVIALGGALGGFFASLSAPSVFDRNYEFLGSALGITLLAIVERFAAQNFLPLVVVVVAITAPLITIGQAQLTADNSGGLHTLHLRNYYGQIVVRTLNDQKKCASETTLHGAEFTDALRSNIPTSYYAEGGAVGLLLRHLQTQKPSLRIGVIGLGVGTLAAYLRPSDSLVFWEIDPLMRDVAVKQFGFIPQSKGKIEIRMIDGRLGVRNDPELFDIIVVDAFSGDSIPLHLITREAMREYAKKAPIIAANISNRYTDLFPVIAANARALGLNAQAIYSAPPQSLSSNDLLSTPSRYVMLSPPATDLELAQLLKDAPSRTGWSYQSTNAPAKFVDWTDSRYSILDVLSVRSVFRSR